ncbi:sensor histidine kinase [Enterococcus durans]|uniref:sensor histidine kinase n=1 Tax=Enterococcus durans TaxID=53345 RepID=UPI0028A0E00D|nr:GHKL domain-containing protein [Enterococcus durans]
MLRLTQQKEIGWVLSILCLLVLTSYYALIIEEYYLEIHSYYGLTNLFFVSMYTGILLIGSVFSIGLIKQSVKNRHLKQEYQSLAEYMKMLELTNNEIRNFRHDYKNILLSIEGYLDEKDYSSLDHYFRKVIMPTITYLEKDSFKILKASNIESSELKSLVVNKVLIAQQKGIDTIIEVPKVIKEIPDHLVMLLIRALGIILDNAIEGADESKNPEIRIAIFDIGNSLTIVVRNSCLENIPPLHQIKKSGFSTKGTGRGRGLAILQELMRDADNVFLETKVDSEYFTQKVIILHE